MYILTFQSKNSNTFGSIGVFETLKEITDQIIELQSDNITGTVKQITYKKGESNKNLKLNDLEASLKQNFNQYCTDEIEGDNHIFNIRQQSNIQTIKESI